MYFLLSLSFLVFNSNISSFISYNTFLKFKIRSILETAENYKKEGKNSSPMNLEIKINTILAYIFKLLAFLHGKDNAIHIQLNPEFSFSSIYLHFK